MELEYQQLDLRYEALRLRRPDRERRLLADLSERGQQVPVVVVSLEAQPARYVLIDGFARTRALHRLGSDTVRATRWELSEPEALLLSRSLRTSEESSLEQGWLLLTLATSFGLSLEELARRFGHSKSWVSRRLALVRELPRSVQELVREGRLGAHAAMKSMVPLARANPQDCEQLALAIAPLLLSSREVEELCKLWQRCDSALRSKLLEAPRLLLECQAELRREAPRVRPAEALLAELDQVAGGARRALKLCPEIASECLDREREAITRCLAQARRDLGRLVEQLFLTPSERAPELDRC